MALRLNPMEKATTWEKTKVLDWTKAMYGPRTQAYGETNYQRINKGFGQNQGIVWSSDSSLWGNQLPEKKQKFWTEPGHCMVLGLNPMGKPTTWEKTKVLDRTKTLYGRRTQAYGETNYLWKKPKVLDRTKAMYGPRTQAYGETIYLRKK